MQGPHRRRQGHRGRGRLRHVQRFLEPCLLFLLHRGPSHGYDLAQGLADFGMGGIDGSMVYRMLREMENAGLIESQWDTGVSSGPARRIYCLTSLGNQSLADWVGQLGETDRILHRFLDQYEHHMREGEGDFH